MSTPSDGSRQRIGATQQSTKENSSLMKKGFSEKMGATATRLSLSSLLDLLTTLSLRDVYRINQSCPITLNAINKQATFGPGNGVDGQQGRMRKALIQVFHHNL